MRDGDIIVGNLNGEVGVCDQKKEVGVCPWKFKLHITKKLLEPNNFLGGANKGTILGLGVK